MSLWRWKNFSEHEVKCKCGCGEAWDKEKHGTAMPEYFIEAMDRLQDLRERWGKPIILNSAHRCVKHNADVGGTERSVHLDIAFDCRATLEYQKDFVATAKAAGFTGIGHYPRHAFIHIDLGRERTWGTPA